MATRSGRHGMLSVKNYGKMVVRYKAAVEKADWWSAYRILGEMKVRFDQLAAASVQPNVKKGYWLSAKQRDTFFKPIQAQLKDELQIMSARVMKAGPGEEHASGDVTTDDDVSTASELWDDWPENKEKPLIAKLWETGDDGLRARMIAVLGALPGMVRLSNLGYLLEGIDPGHRQGLKQQCETWFDTFDDHQESFFDWQLAQGGSGQTETRYNEGKEAQASTRVMFPGGKLVRRSGPITAQMWPIVMTTNMKFYAAPKGPEAVASNVDPRKALRVGKRPKYVQHSTFLAGLPVSSAASFNSTKGKLQVITNHSGHYKPSLLHLVKMLIALRAQGVALGGVRAEDMGEMRAYDAEKLADSGGNIDELKLLK